MNDATPEQESAAPAVDSRSFHDVLKGLVGKPVTVVNPESYEDAPVGHRLTTGFYRGKVGSVAGDYFTIAVEYLHKRAKEKEPVKQFIPLSRVKRISLMKGGERLIHL